MEKKMISAQLTLWVNRAVAVLLAALIFWLPGILRWYTGFRYLSGAEQRWITLSFYCCVAVIGWALWNMDCLLRRILRGEVFIRQNVWAIRQIRWCCGLVSLITAVTCVAYLPLVFLAVIMAFLCLAVSVVVHVMDAAVTIQEENALTI